MQCFFEIKSDYGFIEKEILKKVMKLTSRIENEIIITKKENTLSRNEIIKKKENITLRKIYIHINSLLHFGFWSRETSAVHREYKVNRVAK